MAQDLPTTTGSGTQTATQSPQSAQSGGGVNGPSAQTGGVQPGTATDLLTTSQGGLKLGGAQLTTVGLGTTSTSQEATSPNQISQHHLNPVLVSLSVIFVLIAIGLFWLASRSANSTTD